MFRGNKNKPKDANLSKNYGFRTLIQFSILFPTDVLYIKY